MKICVASPYPLSDLKGNSVTTERIVKILRKAGLDTRGSHGFDGLATDALIALHAKKGAQAVVDYREAFPDGKLIVLLTGTDLYDDFPKGLGFESLEAADFIAITHEESRAMIPERFQEKVVVVPSSLEMPDISAAPESPPFAISVVGHLRPVKRSFLTIEAVAKNPDWEVEVWQLGEALDEESAATACAWQKKDSRYRWFGGLPREEGLRKCAASSLTVNSSILEGGANAVLEAMTMGVPILASHIPGNIGLLGTEYPGYFQEGEIESKLAEILKNPSQLNQWTDLAAERLPVFSRESEREAWMKLLD
ncbi:MAG: glycosyltransferase [Akkermansiaceae bacterium]